MIDLEKTRKWSAKWIGAGPCHVSRRSPVTPAPYFRKEFQYDGDSSVQCFISGLGYYVLTINGKRVGDRELAPNPAIYDKRARYHVYDITPYLKPGTNVCCVVLGTGWYNPYTQARWQFEAASWTDNPKLLLEIRQKNHLLAETDRSWKVTMNGPLRKDGLMTGEIYDARLEFPGWDKPGFDDSEWSCASIVPGPGGVLTEETFPSVIVRRTLPAVKSSFPRIYELKENIAGRVRIRVKGEKGAQIRMTFSDRLCKDGVLYIQNNAMYSIDDLFQTDIYILKGDPKGENWAPSFTYHGFQYVDVEITGKAKILSMEAEVLGTGFPQTGFFRCSKEDLNRLFDCTCLSYTDNFVGVPTDCPHREKNGWTGDAVCALETGLSLFDSATSYAGWLQDLTDTQRPNGQLPGIVPSSGWGFNWGSGPFYDYSLTGIVWEIYRFTGDKDLIRKFYPNIQRLADYMATMAVDHCIAFGLGDWSHPDGEHAVTSELTSTAFYYRHIVLLAEMAKLLKKPEDEKKYRVLAGKIFRAFNRKFYNGDGTYAKGEPTAMATAVYLGLCPEKQIPLTVQKLDESLQKYDYTCYFGILGAKFIPHVLSQYGYTDQAFRLITQEKVPGWTAWLRDGATTLRERWGSYDSYCHVMFGDIAWWMLRWCLGINPDWHHPGFRELVLSPRIPKALTFAEGGCMTPFGPVAIRWKKQAGNKILFETDLPKEIRAFLQLKDGEKIPLKTGPAKKVICQL